LLLEFHGLTAGRQTGKQNVMSTPLRLAICLTTFTLAAGLWQPVIARADLLFAGDDWGNNLYEFDTQVGQSSMVVYSDDLKGVNGLTTDGKGNLFVSDFGSRQILKFTPDGNYETFAQLDSSGGGLVFDRDGNLFVPFQWAGRIDELSPDGHTETIFATNQGAPVQLGFDRSGNLFAADQKSGFVYKFDPDGTRTTFATGLKANALTFDSKGTLFVGSGHTVFKFAADGSRKVFAKGPKSSSCLVFDSQGNLFSADGSGDVYEFKNKSGVLATKPELFATGLGHDYFITVLPGSLASASVLVSSLSSWKLWAILPLLLVASAGVGCWLYWRKRRSPPAAGTEKG
jgi:sugar lactone lactonase YvrE